MIISFVLPVFNCEGNIKPLFTELMATSAKFPMFQPEYIFIDDHSTDGSLKEIQALDSPYIKIVGLKKNVGSYSAALRGLSHVTGARVVIMAADGQDDPMIAYNLIGISNGNGMAAAYRNSSSNGIFASTYHRLMTVLNGVNSSGKIFDIVVFPTTRMKEIVKSRRCQAHLFYGLDFLFPSKFLFKHTKRPRAHGQSGWTLTKKMQLGITSLVVFSQEKLRSR